MKEFRNLESINEGDLSTDQSVMKMNINWLRITVKERKYFIEQNITYLKFKISIFKIYITGSLNVT